MWRRMWYEILKKRGLYGFKDVEIGTKSFLRTNYKVSEPDGAIREENWLIDFARSVTPSGISAYGELVTNNFFDVGVEITPGTLTGSSIQALYDNPRVRVYDHSKLNDILSEEHAIAAKYDVPIEEILPGKATSLMEKLKKCPSGKSHWRDYEGLVEEIFTYLFVPPLGKPKTQSRSVNGLEIRDLIFPNRVKSGYWQSVRFDYKGSYVVVDAKNTKRPDKNDVIQLEDYLQERQTGLFGILCCRKATKSAKQQRRKAYSTDPPKMIVLFDDKDVNDMILKKARGENPEDVLNDRIDLYRLNYRF